MTIYGISVDSTWCHEGWRTAMQMPDGIVLLSDFNRSFGDLYGLTFDAPSGLKRLLRRSAFVIDRDGTVTYVWQEPAPALPKADEVAAEVRKLTR